MLVPQNVHNRAVYRIPCKDCTRSYVGLVKEVTCNTKGHQQAVFTGCSNMSALAEHTVTTGHEVDWPNATVLDSCQAVYQRSYLESVVHTYIKNKTPSTGNVHGPLPSVYQVLLNNQYSPSHPHSHTHLLISTNSTTP